MTPEKKAALKELIGKIAKMTDDQKKAFIEQYPVIMTCEGRGLSVRNTILCIMQSGGAATVVGGFKQWLKMGRAVSKGEHGMTILFPRITGADQEGNGDPEIHFMTGYVFDVSQTHEIETQQAA